MICPFCREEIADGAIKCKHCKTMLVNINSAYSQTNFNSNQEQMSLQEKMSENKKEGNIGFPITSMILGIIAVLLIFDDSHWDEDTIVGAIAISIASLILGIVFTSIQKRGRGMSISGIVTGSLGLLNALGKFIK